MTAMNVKHSGASDPKINIIRDRFIENALRETQGLKAALCLKIQRILVPWIKRLTMVANVKHSGALDPKINTIRDRFIENALRETWTLKAVLCLRSKEF